MDLGRSRSRGGLGASAASSPTDRRMTALTGIALDMAGFLLDHAGRTGL